MLLRRLLSRSATVSVRLRLSLSTATSHPSWAMLHDTMPATVPVPPSGLSASVDLAEPPRESFLFVPYYLLNSSAPDPSSKSKQLLAGDICSASGDGLLLVRYLDIRARDPAADKQTNQVTGVDRDHVPDITRFVCNPVSCELFRLPDIDGTTKILNGGVTNMGLLTQADRGRSPPDRYAVADFSEASRNWVMERFLSDTRKWEIVVSAPFNLPRARAMTVEQEALAFRGRLWWVDLTWGAISADPFDDRPEPRFVELPRGSMLPERTERGAILAQALPRYRRMGVSEGRLRYAEVSQREPFVLSSFVLDEEAGDWTLEHRVALSRVWADGGYPWLPLKGKETPEIGVLDPLNANVMHLTVGKHAVAVDMHNAKVIGSSALSIAGSFIPCLLPQWLGSSRIPSAGKKTIVKNKSFVAHDVPFPVKKNVEKNKTLADVLVRSDRH